MKNKLQCNRNCRKECQNFKYCAEPLLKNQHFRVLPFINSVSENIPHHRCWFSCRCRQQKAVFVLCMWGLQTQTVLLIVKIRNVFKCLTLPRTTNYCTLLLANWDRVRRIQLHITFPKLTLPLRRTIRTHFAWITAVNKLIPSWLMMHVGSAQTH